MRIRNQNSETCNSRTWNNYFLVHCDVDLYARLQYIKLILKLKKKKMGISLQKFGCFRQQRRKKAGTV